MTISVTTTDGGRVDSFITDGTDSSGGSQHTLHIQKYDSGGHAVGSEFTYAQGAPFMPIVLTPLAGGGYVAAYGYAFKGYYYDLSVFDAGGHTLRSLAFTEAAGQKIEIAASPAGGFLVAQQTTVFFHAVNYDGPPVLQLFDNTGAMVGPMGKITGALPTITTTADGHYHLTWADGQLTHSLDFDPHNPPDFSALPAPSVIAVFDMLSGHPAAGAVVDSTPVFRMAVDHTGFLTLTQTPTGDPENGYMLGGTTVTSADVARGYVDMVADHKLLEQDSYYLHWKSDIGVPGALTKQSITVTGDPEITKATDDVGPSTGVLRDGATTDDATPTLHLDLSQSNALDGSQVQILDGGAVVGQATITSADLSRGYIDVTTSALSQGVHHLQTELPNTGLGIASASTFTLSEQPDSTRNGEVLTASRTPDTLNGGVGDDTLNASQGPDQLTGGAGHDAFVFGLEPWAPAHIKDFAVGTDRLDISALLQKAGYTGADPVADGYVKLLDDGNGGTEVFFDPDGPNPAHQWPDNIIDIEHVPVGSATWAQIAGSTTASPPPPPPVSPPPVSPPPAGGAVQTGHDGGSNMMGGSGDDTLIGGASGPDTMTGAGGGDHFQFDTVPWQAATIADFTHGADKIDVSHLLSGVGYSGSDPIADGYIKFGDDGSGNTWVYFDRDGSAGTADQWGTKVATLSHVSAGSLTPSDWIFQSGGGGSPPPPPPPSPPPPPPSTGTVRTGQDGGSNLVGGSGDDTLIGGHGQDTMTGAAGADHFTWTDLPWAYAQVTDFTHGTDHIDVSALLTKYGYSGSDPVADGYIKFGDDGQGNTWVYFDRDGAAGTADMWGTHLATLNHVSASTLSGGDFIFH